MKWLQWSKIDLEKGLGGVEEHARCVARELRRLGVEVSFSADPTIISDPSWDVIHTHGGIFLPRPYLNRSAVRLHTLHGTTLGRMAACGEWFWPRGYLAELSEIRGVVQSDVTLSVHPDLSLFRLAEKLGKETAVCGNGWDSGEDEEPLPNDLLKRIHPDRPLWLYVGRGDDPVKGADRVQALLTLRPETMLLAVPGAGFSENSNVIRSGRLSASQVRALLKRASGILMLSRYEGNSLVVLEALSLGLPVVTTPVGAASFLPKEIRGLWKVPHGDIEQTKRVMNQVESIADAKTREVDALVNQKILPRWKEVAEIAVRAVEHAKHRRRRS